MSKKNQIGVGWNKTSRDGKYPFVGLILDIASLVQLAHSVGSTQKSLAESSAHPIEI